MDACEYRVFVGGTNGVIYQLNLYKKIGPRAYSVAAQDDVSEDVAFTGHSDSVNGLGVSLDGSLLVSASADGLVLVWDTSSRQILKRFTSHKGAVTQLHVLQRPHDVFGVGERALPPLGNLRRFQHTSETAAPPVPIRLGNTVEDALMDNYAGVLKLGDSARSASQYEDMEMCDVTHAVGMLTRQGALALPQMEVERLQRQQPSKRGKASGSE
eukprot:Colp12_sorted_trinity150504_noHs@24115